MRFSRIIHTRHIGCYCSSDSKAIALLATEVSHVLDESLRRKNPVSCAHGTGGNLGILYNQQKEPLPAAAQARSWAFNEALPPSSSESLNLGFIELICDSAGFVSYKKRLNLNWDRF